MPARGSSDCRPTTDATEEQRTLVRVCEVQVLNPAGRAAEAAIGPHPRREADPQEQCPDGLGQGHQSDGAATEC